MISVIWRKSGTLWHACLEYWDDMALCGYAIPLRAETHHDPEGERCSECLRKAREG